MADSQHTQDIIPRHQWTYDGTRVLVLRCGAVGYGGFEWPTTIGARLRVDTPTREAECDAGGFYGWPWGFGIGDGKDPDWRALWIVFAAEPEDVVPVGNKVKCCGEVEIIYVGDWAAAMAYVLPGQMAWVAHAARGVDFATGDRDVASATGECGAASATGEYGAASATGVYGAASATGGRGAASVTGECGAASATGACSVAGVTGLYGRARGGPYSAIALAWWNDRDQRAEMRCARIGCGDGTDGLLKAGVWYHLNDQGDFVESA